MYKVISMIQTKRKRKYIQYVRPFTKLSMYFEITKTNPKTTHDLSILIFHSIYLKLELVSNTTQSQ